MKQIIRYQADDNTVWDTAAMAEARDKEVLTADQIHRIIGKPTYFRGWIQHNPEEVREFKQKVFEATRHLVSKNCNSVSDLNPSSMASRIMGDGPVTPLSDLWNRAC